MVEFRLPKNSRVETGKVWPKPDSPSSIRAPASRTFAEPRTPASAAAGRLVLFAARTCQGRNSAKAASDTILYHMAANATVRDLRNRFPKVRKLVEKHYENGGTRTIVRKLSAEERREEIARMLSGASVTDEARAQAAKLLEAA